MPSRPTLVSRTSLKNSSSVRELSTSAASGAYQGLLVRSLDQMFVVVGSQSRLLASLRGLPCRDTMFEIPLSRSMPSLIVSCAGFLA